jgi:hypothetical protein
LKSDSTDAMSVSRPLWIDDGMNVLVGIAALGVAALADAALAAAAVAAALATREGDDLSVRGVVGLDGICPPIGRMGELDTTCEVPDPFHQWGGV